MNISLPKNLKNIVILTGAGISAESGLKTFRDSNGLWEEHRIEEVASPEGYAKDPELVQRFYNLRRMHLNEVAPNAAHDALVRLQREFEGSVQLITQNVDDLHERDGHNEVLHMHGELRKIRHTQTGEVKEFKGEVSREDYLTWRPHIVWFGESIFGSETIYDWLSKADLFISIGTSGQVYPAAGFVEISKGQGAMTVELNLEKTPHLFDETILGPATDIVPELVDLLLRGIESS